MENEKRLIDANELMSEVHRYDEQQKNDVWLTSDIAALLAEQPTVDAVEVVHGRCPYCDSENNDFIPLNQSVEYSGIEMALNRQGMLRVRYYMYNGVDHFESQDIVNIKFCPNCGRAMNGRTNSVETIGFADESGLASAT